MACSKSFLVVAASLFLVGGPGCVEEGDRLPPPSPADTSGVGGGGGSGGEGGGGPVTPPNVCECAYSAIVSVECGNCVNLAAFDECTTAGQACAADGSCENIAGCPGKCNSLPAAEKPSCAANCVLNNQDASGFPLYEALMECVCELCAEYCKPDSPLACE